MYIKPEEAFKRMNAASIIKQNVYIYAATGYGKTEFVKQYFNGKKHVYIPCTATECDTSELNKNADKEKIVIFDGIWAVEDSEVKNIIIECCLRTNYWVILISRGQIPNWLSNSTFGMDFLLINENMLSISRKALQELVTERNLQMTMGELENLSISSQGNPVAVFSYLRELDAGNKLSEQIIDKVLNAFLYHLEHSVIREWPSEYADFMCIMGLVDDFTEQQAMIMTGNPLVQEKMTRCMEMGNFITYENNRYYIRDYFVEALRREARRRFTKEEIDSYYMLAGRYYEMSNDDVKALEIYSKINNQVAITHVLIRNAQKTPDVGYYFWMKEYYFALDEEIIRRNVYLITGMSLLYSILMDIDKSEYWYQQLKVYCENSGGAEKREAEKQLAYLDIALPTRGSIDVLKLIKNYYSIFKDKSMTFPSFCISSNLPSIMNGGKDFCEWSKHDRQLALSVGKLLTSFLGKHGKGLVSQALAESLWEKGESISEVNSLLQRAKVEMSSNGSIQMKFVNVGIMVRYYIALGEIDHAKRILDVFEENIDANIKDGIWMNLQAMKCRIALYEGKLEVAEKYILKAPDENKFFYTMYRYWYLTKIRYYIAKAEYVKADSLIQAIKYYAEVNYRTYIAMEAKVLLAIVKYRQKEEWKTEFISALEQISDYHFVRILSEEGDAVYPLIAEAGDEIKASEKIDNDWMIQVVDEIGKMSRRYKTYLKSQAMEMPDIAPFDVRVLACLADGFSVPMAAEYLKINYETLRSRIKEIYKKLGAKNKTDAVMIARSLGII